MTSGPTGPDDGTSLPPSPPPSPDEAAPPASQRPGLTTFTIEGRQAPGLFVLGWLASISGLALVLIGALASSALIFYVLGPVVLLVGLVAGAGSQAIERRARGSAYAGPSPYLVLGAIVAAVYAVGGSIALLLGAILGRVTAPDYVQALIGGAIQAAVYVGIIRLTVVDQGALSWRDMGWFRFDGAQLRNAAIGALVAVPVIALTSIVAALLVGIFGQVPDSPLPATGTPIGLIANLVTGFLIAPISEETVFRGFAQTAWTRAVGERGAILRASLIFALAHVIDARGDTFSQVLVFMVIGFVGRIPVAFALGWLFARTRSIWTPIGLHMAFNGILLVLAEVALRSGAV